jgi:hypothetical protein
MKKREAQHIMNGMFTYLKRIGDVTFDVSLLGTDIEHFPGSFEKQGVNTKNIPILPMFKNLFLEIIFQHIMELNKKVDNAWGDFHFVTFYIRPNEKVVEMEHFIETVEYSNQTPKRFTGPQIINQTMDENDCNWFSIEFSAQYGTFDLDPYTLESDSDKLLWGDVNQHKSRFEDYVTGYFPFAKKDSGSSGTIRVRNGIVSISCDYRELIWVPSGINVKYEPNSFDD